MKRRLRESPAERRQERSRLGLSLIEVSISSLLTGIVLVAALRSVGGVALTWRATEEKSVATALADQLMSEVLQACYDDPEADEPEFGVEDDEDDETRSDFDDIDDYDQWNSKPEAKDGTSLAGFSSWRRKVDVRRIDPTDLGFVEPHDPDMDLRRIKVTVTAPGGNTVEIFAYRSRYGVMEQLPEQDTTFVTWVGTSLRTIANSKSVAGGTDISNHAIDQ